MNFGSVSPSGIQLLTSPITIRGKNGTKLNITGLRDPSSSKHGTGLSQVIPLIYGSQKPRNHKGLETFNSNSHSDGQEQPNRVFENNGNISQNFKQDNRNWSEANIIGKSRVPEIQMINKYYGLIPKKFTMHSRHSADRNIRNSRSGTKLRAKSAMPLLSIKKSSLDDSDSTSEYTEPLVKVEVKARRGSSSGTNRSQEIGDKSTSSPNKQNHVELVTTKMSVEKQHKKWRHRRSSSLSLMETGSPQNCHATKPTTNGSYKEAQRVIKIDLNNMRWEETCQSNSTSDEPQSPSPNSSPRYINNYNNLNLNDPYNIHEFDEGTPINTTTTSTTFHNSPSNSFLPKPSSIGCSTGTSTISTLTSSNDNLALNQLQPTLKSLVDFKSQVGDSSFVAAPMHNEESYNRTVGNINDGISSETSAPVFGKSGGLGTVTNVNDSSTPTSSINKRQRFRKTISFDEQILRTTEVNSNGSGKPDTEIMKPRRPQTANTRPSIISNNNNPQNPPSKVHPWTQRSNQGMSLSERRAKLQRSVSIHSSDSFDYGEGECSDLEAESSSLTTVSKNATPSIFPRPNSSAYKETRKSLFFQPPPEVPTMISLLSPIETLEIQYEIEKVAVMLKNMQNQNKSFIDLCPADSSSPTSSSSKTMDKMLRSTKKDNKIPMDARDDINGNPTSNNTITPGAKSIIPEGRPPCEALLEKTVETIIHGGGDAFNHKLQNEPDELRSGPGTAKDSNLNKHIQPDCNLVPVSVEDIGGRIPTNNEQSIPGGPCSSDPISSIVQTPPPWPLYSTEPGARRPTLKKSVSISCEKELFGTAGYQNEVNGNVNSPQLNKNKSARPKTAAITTFSPSGQGTPKPFLLSRSSSTSAITLTPTPTSFNSHRPRSKVLNPNQSHSPIPKVDRSTPTGMNNDKPGTNSLRISPSAPIVGESSPSQSQALRNRKILIKKALIEINQSYLGKKWGILGRPKTAPSTGASSNHKKPVTSPNAMMMSCGQNQKRLPLKASPPPSTGLKPGQPGAGVILNQKTDPKGESYALSEEKIEPETEMENSSSGNNRKTLHRQSFSLDEGLLLGFSNKEFGWDSASIHGTCDDSSTVRDGLSILSSKKREECLKIYDKMVKTGFAVKLDTIFRGMMTPSEYRAFIKAAETAARDAADAAAEEDLKESSGDKTVDAGVNSVSSEVQNVSTLSS